MIAGTNGGKLSSDPPQAHGDVRIDLIDPTRGVVPILGQDLCPLLSTYRTDEAVSSAIGWMRKTLGLSECSLEQINSTARYSDCRALVSQRAKS